MYRISFSIDGDSFEYDIVEGVYSDEPDYPSVEHSFDELVAVQNELLRNVESLCFTISVTDECNLKCTYCFENHAHHYLSSNTIHPIANLIEKCLATHETIKRVVVIWFGGEPMLNLDYICLASKSFIQVCEKAQVQYLSKMITNGVFTDRLLPYVSEIRLDGIQITLDGTKDVHNARRTDPDGFGTYETIIRNLTKLFNKLNVIIRVNISEDNIDDAFTLCDELLSIIPMNTETRVFFQPALIEDYNQSGKFCRSAPVPASHFIDKYVSLLEYSGMLSIPRFIYSHCNISIPGSLLIRADGSLCKCWAQATDNNSGVLTINSDVNHIMRYVVVSGIAKTSKRCNNVTYFLHAWVAAQQLPITWKVV